MKQVLEISKSDLAGARDTNSREFLETTFIKAEEVIKAGGTVHLMQVLARAAGHQHLNQFSIDDLTTFKMELAQLTGVAYGGVAPINQEY